MLRFFYKTFYYENFTYHLVIPKQVIVDKLNELFTTKNNIFKSPNLKGSFINYPDTFRISPKWSFTYIKNYESEPAYLKGSIVEESKFLTTLEISVRPNSVYIILLIVFSMFGIYSLINAAITHKFIALLTGLWIIGFSFPVLYFFAKNASKNLRKSFENYLSIKH